MIAKARADQLVFDQGLAESKEQARRLIMAGKVAIFDEEHPERQPLVVQKPGHPYKITTQFQLVGVERFVSRGAYKLLTAIEHYKLDVTGLVCLDAGASTGGFTDCLLQHGARRVMAVDVGTNQLAYKLRSDPRVWVRENFNARHLTVADIPERPARAVTDVSFISLRLILPPMAEVLLPGGEMVSLVKPQFEAGRGEAPGGVVTDPAVRERALGGILDFGRGELGLELLGVEESPIRGREKGNIEYLAWWRKSGEARP